MFSRQQFILLLSLPLLFAVGESRESLYLSEAAYRGALPQNEVNHVQRASVQAFELKDVFFHEFSSVDGAPQLYTISKSESQDSRRAFRQHVEKRPALRISSRQVHISRRRSTAAPITQQWPYVGPHFRQSSHAFDQWDTVLVPGPDLKDKDTVVNLGKMCSDAYTNAPSEPDWLNATLGFNQSGSFGWDSDGLRGHIFSDRTNETIIVAFKGTTLDLGNHFNSKDRLNDNLLFSCCCATQRPDPFWYGRVCDCKTDTYQCNSTCLTQELIQEDRYYSTAIAVMRNVSAWYPNATLWTTGHSLGGSIASLMGLTFNIPSVSIEAPPQKLPAERIGLAIPPHTADYHIGNTADPVFMGACNGYFSTCSIAGYAFESQCHTGKRCVYDTVKDKGWRLSIANHRINTVITQVLEAYNSTPACEADDECVDCYNWNFHNDGH